MWNATLTLKWRSSGRERGKLLLHLVACDDGCLPLLRTGIGRRRLMAGAAGARTCNRPQLRRLARSKTILLTRADAACLDAIRAGAGRQNLIALQTKLTLKDAAGSIAKLAAAGLVIRQQRSCWEATRSGRVRETNSGKFDLAPPRIVLLPYSTTPGAAPSCPKEGARTLLPRSAARRGTFDVKQLGFGKAVFG